MNQPIPRPSLSLAFNLAMTHTRRVLFDPFDLGKWFVIGFCAWLAALGDQGFGFTGNFPGQFNGAGPKPGQPNFNLGGFVPKIVDYWHSNFAWLLPVVILGGLAILILGLLVQWLNSRGKFMLLHCVANNTAEIRYPWSHHAHSANRYFLFRILIGIAVALVMIPIAAIVAFGVYSGFQTGVWHPLRTLAMFASGLFILAPVGLLSFVGMKLTTDFGIPIMFKLNCGPVEAWRHLWPIISARFGSIVLYLLFSILLSIGIGLAVLTLVVVTCCTAACLMVIPYIGTVFLLPTFVLLRSFSALYFGQLAPEFDVFPDPSPLNFN